MARKSTQAKRTGKRRSARTGRPPRELAGEVDTRILDAAFQTFLERGLAGASVDEIAGRARAGKPTIYARFSSKEELFTAVVVRHMASNAARFDSHVPTGVTVEERLAGVGAAVLHWGLASETVELMRLAIAEARRLPELASSVGQMAREHAAEGVARLLHEAVLSDDLGTLPPFGPEHLAATAGVFLDLILLPLMVRALLGEQLRRLHAEIVPHAEGSVAFFVAACRNDASILMGMGRA
jgi:AcrR family transcriptional regulator